MPHAAHISSLIWWLIKHIKCVSSSILTQSTLKYQFVFAPGEKGKHCKQTEIYDFRICTVNLTVLLKVIHCVLPYKGSIRYKYYVWKHKHTTWNYQLQPTLMEEMLWPICRQTWCRNKKANMTIVWGHSFSTVCVVSKEKYATTKIFQCVIHTVLF